MKSFFHPLLLRLSAFALITAIVVAEDVTTTDGKVYPNTTIRRSGSLVMLKVALEGSTSMIEMGLPIERIAKVSFIEPPELAKAKAAASKGNAQEVINLTTSYVANQSSLKDLPGSWWPAMAQIRLLALASAGKDAETANLAREVGTIKTSIAESLARGGTLFASLFSSDLEAVIVGAKSLPVIGGGQGSALAQLALGRALALKKDYAGAVRCFLTIKIFYPSITLLQPAAMLGAATSYIGLADPKRALQTFNAIVEDWPDSPQVPEAKKRADILSHS